MTALAIKARSNVVSPRLIGEHIHSFDDKRADIAIDESRKRAHSWRDDGRDQVVYEALRVAGFPVGRRAAEVVAAGATDGWWEPLWVAAR
jgi:hypothetical protein